MFDPKVVAQDFPILQQQANEKRLVYLDSAATSQKPTAVIDALVQYYRTSNANVHRGVHHLSDVSTQAWEESRQTIAEFFGAHPDELILTRNTTESLNGTAYGWGLDHLGADDVIITTILEHHANIVPWQQLALRVGARVEYLGVDAAGRLDLTALEEFMTKHGARVKLLAISHVSNALGTVAPLEKIVDIIQKVYGSTAAVGERPLLVLDAAQSAPHVPLNFAKLGFDCLAASGHKMLGPMGSGVLLVKRTLLDSNAFKPWLFGGGMISEVSTVSTQFNQQTSERFTPGTPDVASAVGLAAACRYLNTLGMSSVQEHDHELVQYAVDQLRELPQLQLIGPLDPLESSGTLDRIGSVSFLYKGVHAHDVAQVLDSDGVAVRSGHHCTMPLHTQNHWQATVRASFHVYTSKEDIDALVAALHKVQTVFHSSSN